MQNQVRVIGRRSRLGRLTTDGASWALALTVVTMLGCATAKPRSELTTAPEKRSDYWPAVQFDTKGVDFGPWIRRFFAQIKRNWVIPAEANALNDKGLAHGGHVAVQFYIHKDGSITNIVVSGPCNVQSFNEASEKAVAASSPTSPLPPKYPSEQALFTVTFYYNEAPPKQ